MPVIPQIPGVLLRELSHCSEQRVQVDLRGGEQGCAGTLEVGYDVRVIGEHSKSRRTHPLGLLEAIQAERALVLSEVTFPPVV
jgi:hypothetical protein